MKRMSEFKDDILPNGHFRSQKVKMRLKEKIVSEVAPNGSIMAISWKKKELRRLCLSEKPILKVPDKLWTHFSFPFEVMEDVLNGVAARMTIVVFIPPYDAATMQMIANKMQDQIYDHANEAYLHQKAAVNSLIRTISKKSPQISLAEKMVSLFDHEEGYKRAIRFTSWSVLPADLLQVRILWDESEEDDDRRIIEVETTLLFDQRIVNDKNHLRINRKGLLSFNARNWTMVFDLEKARNAEIEPLEKLATPERIEEISDEESPPTETKRNPAKRIKLECRFAISSDEE